MNLYCYADIMCVFHSRLESQFKGDSGSEDEPQPRKKIVSTGSTG